MENNNPIGELMQTTMENVKNILKVDTVVGDPIYTPDGITLVPISKISVGFGGGGVEFNSKKAGIPENADAAAENMEEETKNIQAVERTDSNGEQ